MKRIAFSALALVLSVPAWAAPTPTITVPNATAAASVPAATSVSTVPQETVITSDSSEVQGTDTENVITFTGSVKMTGTDLLMTCDNLKVTAYRKGDPKAAIGKYSAFKTLVATGHVRILQADRVATCGRAEVLPGEDRVVLTDHPTVKDSTDAYAITGYRMTLYRNVRRAVVESDPNERVIVTMPTIKDLGFDAGTTDSGSPSGKAK